ncbi:MAG: hypothetical protein O2954_05435 [bacterium]|nr:hypothetical protein [bacterium]
MNWVTEVAAAICAIIATGGFTTYFVLTKTIQKLEKMNQDKDRTEQLEVRLNELEKRLTDVQDVVLSIDDRLDHPANRSEPEIRN